MVLIYSLSIELLVLHVNVFSVRRSGYCYLKSVQDQHLVPRNISEQFSQTGLETVIT